MVQLIILFSAMAYNKYPFLIFFFVTETLTCSPDEFDCGHSVCINDIFLCNGESYCIDGSDESYCGKV